MSKFSDVGKAGAMGGMSGGLEEEEDVDDEMFAKKSAMQSLGKHIGAGGSDDESGVDSSDESDEENVSGMPIMKYKRKNKKSGGGKGGGGMGGMDMSSMMGMMGGGGAGGAM